jgi:hypothetical protein
MFMHVRTSSARPVQAGAHRIALMVLATTVAVLAGALPATAAIGPGGGDLPGDGGGGGSGDGGGAGGGTPTDCLGESTGSLWASPDRVDLGANTTLHWSVQPAPGCAGMTQSISGIGAVPRTGSLQVQPAGPSSWTLFGKKGAGSRDLASASVDINLPTPNGRPEVTISADNQVNLFLQAMTEPTAIIRINDGVSLDLSNRENLHIAPGVQILGARTTTAPGPKLFTTTFPTRLFIIEGAPGVTIRGIRLRGAEMGTADEDAPISNGISVISSVNVDIANNEISGWRGAAVEVRDPAHVINLANHDAVRVHENYIHHNQHYREEGYGVATYESAYATIEKNLFDYNRHAIASSGDPGTGYYAHSNLVLWNGGMNSGTLNINTHMFDVHGTQSCWGFGYYCGPAGEKFDIRHNTILYDAGSAIKVRGEPSIGAYVDNNVFTHTQEWGGYLDDAALVQTTGHNLYATNNKFGKLMLDMKGPTSCDFNKDGILDTFIATGQTWWYWYWNDAESAGRYTYLNTSTKGLSQLAVGDVSGDGVCDVADDDGVVYIDGSHAIQPPPSSLPVVPNVRGGTVAEASAALMAAGFVKGDVTYVVDPTCNDLGKVVGQVPVAGAHAEPGTAVRLSVGDRPSTPCL